MDIKQYQYRNEVTIPINRVNILTNFDYRF